MSEYVMLQQQFQQLQQSQLAPELVHPIEARAATLRAHYGRQGKTVYDRLDRWREEHAKCVPGSHESSIEGCMYVIHCKDRGAVAVCESWQFTGVLL